jgi:hypothetical protein
VVTENDGLAARCRMGWREIPEGKVKLVGDWPWVGFHTGARKFDVPISSYVSMKDRASSLSRRRCDPQTFEILNQGSTEAVQFDGVA